MSYIQLPTRTSADPNSATDVNQLQANIEALKGGTGSTAPTDTLENKVSKSTFDANTILKADTDNTPAALTVGEQTLVGRLTGGNIAALTPTQIRTLISSVVTADNFASGYFDIGNMRIQWGQTAAITASTISSNYFGSTSGDTIIGSGSTSFPTTFKSGTTPKVVVTPTIGTTRCVSMNIESLSNSSFEVFSATQYTNGTGKNVSFYYLAIGEKP
jgi:hypothetical protein